MRSEHSLFSLIHLFSLLIILFLGLFFIFLPSSPQLRFLLAKMLSESSNIFPKIGTSLVGFCFLLLTGFYFLNKKKSIRYKMLCHKTIIEEAIVEDYVKKYFKKIFPDRDVVLESRVDWPQHLEIVVRFPEMGEKDKEHLLKRIQNELGVILARNLGYKKEFYLTLHT